jgi:hypothetical protein
MAARLTVRKAANSVQRARRSPRNIEGKVIIGYGNQFRNEGNLKMHSTPTSQKFFTLFYSFSAASLLVLGCGRKLAVNQTYDNEVTEFEKKVRDEGDAQALQTWAVRILNECRLLPKTNGTDDCGAFWIEMKPDVVRKLHATRTPEVYAFVYTPSLEQYSHLAIRWGDGPSGHWGLNIGPTNMENIPAPWSEEWKPGFFFWREFAPQQKKL